MFFLFTSVSTISSCAVAHLHMLVNVLHAHRGQASKACDMEGKMGRQSQGKTQCRSLNAGTWQKNKSCGCHNFSKKDKDQTGWLGVQRKQRIYCHKYRDK